jgi:hypothetical protein
VVRMVSGLSYTRVYSDADGETRFGEAEMEIRPVPFVPPAPPLGLSEFIPVQRLAFMQIQADWEGGWHPAPRRQFLLVLSGMIRCEVSNDGVRVFKIGDVVLLEDTTGKGHNITSVGGDSLLGVVQLREPGPNKAA